MNTKNRNVKKILSVFIFLIMVWFLLLQTAACDTAENVVTDQSSKPAEIKDSGRDVEHDDGQGENIAGSEDPAIPGSHIIALHPDAVEDVENLPDITTYDMELEVDFNEGSYEGIAEIGYTNLEDTSLENLFFRLFPNSGRAYGNGRIEILEVKVDDQDIQSEYSLGDSTLELKLPETLSPGENLKVRLEFKGEVPVDYGDDGYGIFNKSENVMCLAGWFPIIPVYDDEGWNIDPSSAIGDSVYCDMAYFDVEVTAAANLEIIATGNSAGSKNISGGKKQHNFVSGPARDFILVLSPDFQSVSKTVQGSEINVYYFRDNESIAKETLVTAEGCIETFNKRFGPYPYSEFDLVEVPMNGSIGIEFPGIVLFGSLVFGDTVFTAHEVAHQWWYNAVGNDIYDDPWLDEALTTYSSLIYLEENPSSLDFQQVLNYFKGEYEKNVKAGGDDIVTEGLDHFEELGGKHYSLVVYVKGALFYQAVREIIGDNAFYSALQDYYQDKKYSIASPDDILDRFEQASGQQLDDIYEEWLYSKK